MLKVFREHLTYFKWILWVVAATFVLFFGVSWWQPGSGRASGHEVASVNGSEISFPAWRETAERLENQYRRSFGDQWAQFREKVDLQRMAAEQLIQRELIIQDARRLGLDASNAEVAALIREDPGFQKDGVFIGTAEYERFIQRATNYPSTEAYENYLRGQLLVSKWRALLAASVVISPEQVQDEFRRRHERVEFDYLALDVAKYEASISPSDAELTTWYDAHADRYDLGEGRRAIYVIFDEAAAEAKVDITDAEIEEYYNSQKDLFSTPEERRASHILIKLPEDAPAEAIEAARAKIDDIAQRVRAGEDFATLAREFSDDPASKPNGGDLGWFGKGRMVPAFGEAVFSMKEGAISDPVRTNYGFHLIRLDGIRPSGVQPLDEVREQIRGQLRFPKLRAVQEELAEAFKAKVSDAESFRATAVSEGLELKDTGIVPRSGSIPDLGPVPEMISTIFALDKNTISDIIALPRGEVMLFVDEIVSNYIPPLASQHERVLADFRKEKALDMAQRELEKALARSGNDLARAAQRLGVELLHTDQAMARGQAIAQLGRDARVEDAAFAAAVGEIVGPIQAAKAAVALKINSRQEADMSQLPDEGEQIRAELRGPIVNRLLETRVKEMYDEAEISFNPSLIDTNRSS